MQRKYKADLTLLLVAFIWGASFTLMRNTISLIPAIPYLAIRFSIAAVVLILIFRRKLSGLNRKTIVRGCIIGLTLYFGMGLQVFGLYFTTATNSAFITGLNFVFVPIISAILLKKRPSPLMWTGVAVAALGLFSMTGGVDSSFNSGDFLTLLNAMCWAVQIIIIDKYTEDSEGAQLGVVQVSFTALLFLSTWFVMSFFTDNAPLPLDSPYVWGVLLWTGLGGTAFAFAAQTIMQKFTTPTHTALIFSMEPVFGMLFALLIPSLDGQVETMTLFKGLGCALIFAGMLICEFGGNKKKDEIKA
ncbi:MAG: DMT family transporter [Eubacteriales bacterium]